MGTGQFLRQEYLATPLPLHVGTVGELNNSAYMSVMSNSFGWNSTVWTANNRAFYVPVNLSAAFTVARFFVANGTDLTGTIDIGLYDIAGNLLLSTGNSARSGASSIQYLGVTDTTFPKGHYYLALVASSTTGRFIRTSAGGFLDSVGWLQEDLGSATLPATMTPVAASSGSYWIFGFTQSDTL